MQAASGAGTRQAAPPPLQPSPEIVEQLVAMGFSENGSKRATLAVQVGHAGISMSCCVSTRSMQSAVVATPGPGGGLTCCALAAAERLSAKHGAQACPVILGARLGCCGAAAAQAGPQERLEQQAAHAVRWPSQQLWLCSGGYPACCPCRRAVQRPACSRCSAT